MAHIFSPAQAQGAALWDFLSPNKEKNLLKLLLIQTISSRVSLLCCSALGGTSIFSCLEKLHWAHSGLAAGSTGRIQTLN